MDLSEIIIKLILGGGFLLNGVTGVVTRRTQFGLSTGWSHLWGFPVNFHGEAALVFNSTLLLCGLFIAAQPVVEIMSPEEGFSGSTRSILSMLAFGALFLGLVISAVIQFAVSLGESYRATMDRDSKANRGSEEDVEDDQG